MDEEGSRAVAPLLRSVGRDRLFPWAGYVRKRAPGRLQPAGSRSRRWERRGWALGRGPRPQPAGSRPRFQLSSLVPSGRTRLGRLVARSLQSHIAGAVINRQMGTPAHLNLPVSQVSWQDLPVLLQALVGWGPVGQNRGCLGRTVRKASRIG